jgi:hypothetical protein
MVLPNLSSMLHLDSFSPKVKIGRRHEAEVFCLAVGIWLYSPPPRLYERLFSLIFVPERSLAWMLG